MKALILTYIFFLCFLLMHDPTLSLSSMQNHNPRYNRSLRGKQPSPPPPKSSKFNRQEAPPSPPEFVPPPPPPPQPRISRPFRPPPPPPSY
ncbi:hypothetical protein ACP275_06G125300 [Erythranthe tilingii]